MMETVVTDMDGTLLAKGGAVIQPLNKEVLLDWQKRGKKLVLATGRLDLAIMPFIHELGITMPVISCNGALVRDFQKNEILMKSDISYDLLAQVIELVRGFGVDYHVYTTERIVGPTVTGKIAGFVEANKTLPENEKVPLTVTEDVVGEIVRSGEFALKVLVISDDADKRVAVREALAQLPLSVMASGTTLIDIMNVGIDKAHGLAYLDEAGWLDLETTIAFGDNENDIGMIELAKMGVAMENSIPETLAIADYIAGHHDTGGLAQFLLDFEK
ncbi:hydrolase [Listeria weihenstephanensis]|uniref:Hydrolase n=2 Tax=Listeria weihenstephanensis TaxID=1006155 RepID=A0A1S7FYF4_9LIST|nr:hydrolase [Listeria weihenstephanensis]